MASETASPSLVHGLSVGLTFLYCGLALVVSVWCWFQWKYRKLLRVAAKLPTGVPAFPVVGHVYLFVYGWERVMAILFEAIKRSVENGERAFCFWCGPFPYIIVLNVTDIQTILNSSVALDKGVDYKNMFSDVDTVVGPIKYCLFTVPADRWRVTRRHLNSLFLPRNLNQLFTTYNKTSKDLVARLSGHVARGPLNIIHPLVDTCLMNVCYLLFGSDLELDLPNGIFELLGQLPEMYAQLLVKRAAHPWLKSEVVHRFLNRELLKTVNKVWNNFTETCIKVTNERWEGTVDKERDTGSTTNLNHQESLTILDVFRNLRDKQPDLTEADLRAEILSLYIAGFDTVANVLSYCIMALAQHQDIQNNVYNEILTTVGHVKDVVAEDLGKLQYLEQVLKETMRRFTLVPLIVRKTTQDLELSSYNLPAGANVVMALVAVHMDPKLYPNPERFDPDRFSPENTVTRDRFAYVPFSGGPRDCIGKVYAMQQMKVVMVHLLRKYRIRPVRDVCKLRIKYAMVASSIDGFHVSLEQRRRL